MDSIELARRVATDLFKARQYLAAAIVYGEALKQKFENAPLLLGFGAAVGNSAGVLVTKPFIDWSARILERCLLVEPTGPNADVAKERLAELAKKSEYEKLPPLEPSDLDALVEFLDIEPASLMANAVAALAENDRMGAIMGLGGLASPRFASAMAMAVSGEWGGSPGCAALKRIHPYAGHRIVRDAMVTARARPDAEDLFGPYLRFAESAVASIPITVETPPGYRKVRPPGTANDDEPAAPPATNPWWKFWN